MNWSWQEIPPPEWPENNDPGRLDGAVIQDYAVDPSDPRRIFVTDSRYVMMTKDEGCTWKEVFSSVGIGDLPDEANPYADDRSENRVEDIVIPSWGQGRVYITVSKIICCDPVGYVGLRNPLIVVSDNGVDGWRDASTGLPLENTYVAHLLPSPTRKNVLYALTADMGAYRASYTPLNVYVSNDGGNQWEQRSLGRDDPEAPDSRVFLVPGPARSDAAEDLLLGEWTPRDNLNLANTNTGTTKLVRSTDGGRSWELVSELPRHVEQAAAISRDHRAFGLAMRRSAKGELQGSVFLDKDDYTTVQYRWDAGRGWQEADTGLPQWRCGSNSYSPPTSVAIGKTIDQLVATTTMKRGCDAAPGAAYRYSKRLGRWLDITPYGSALDRYCTYGCRLAQVTSYTAGRKTHFYTVVGGSFGWSALFRFTGGLG